MDSISHLFGQYGYFVLFCGLFLESLAAPFPGELAMAYSGYMISLDRFHLSLVILYAFLGASIGTTVTYYLGRKLGTPFFEKYGKYLLMHPKRISKITKWIEKYGSKLLLISYFIPGFRHFTGYVSGIAGYRFRTFLIFNHIGALLWVTVYVLLGKILGKRLEIVLHLLQTYVFSAVIYILAAIVAVVFIRKHRAAKLDCLHDKYN